MVERRLCPSTSKKNSQSLCKWYNKGHIDYHLFIVCFEAIFVLHCIFATIIICLHNIFLNMSVIFDKSIRMVKKKIAKPSRFQLWQVWRFKEPGSRVEWDKLQARLE